MMENIFISEMVHSLAFVFLIKLILEKDWLPIWRRQDPTSGLQLRIYVKCKYYCKAKRDVWNYFFALPDQENIYIFSSPPPPPPALYLIYCLLDCTDL